MSAKVKDMASADDNTVTGLATCLYPFFASFYLKKTSLFVALRDVGSNVLQAASKTVAKDKENDPSAVIEVSRDI